MKTRKYNSIISLAILSTLGLSACNINLTTDEQTRETINKTSTGVIDALGRLTVNGVTYDTSNATVVTDGNNATTSDLKLGMVVSVSGTESNDGTGTATYIEYEDVTEGIVVANNSSVDNTLSIMNQTVHIDNKTVFDSNDTAITNLSDIDPGNIVEVSGYTSGDGAIWATRIEVKKLAFESGDEIEVKGKISNLSDTTFNIGDLTVDYSNLTLNQPLKNDLYIEVSSMQGLSNMSQLLADEIEIKGDGNISVKRANNDEEVVLKGRVTEVTNGSTIEVNGTTIHLSNSTSFKNGNSSNLVNGAIIEVEGYVDIDGNFQAKELEFENESENDSNDSSDKSDTDDDDDSDSDSDSSDSDSDEKNETENDHDD